MLTSNNFCRITGVLCSVCRRIHYWEVKSNSVPNKVNSWCPALLFTCCCFLWLSESRPGACLVVSGPGLIHALGGMANANMNCWYDSITTAVYCTTNKVFMK